MCFGASIKEAHWAKMSWWRLIRVKEEKVVPGNNAFYHLCTYPSWCLKASCSAFSPLTAFAKCCSFHCWTSVCREWSLDTREWCRAPTVMEMYLPHPPHSHFLPGGSSRVNSSVKPFLPLWPTLTTLPFEFLWHYYFQLSLSLLIRNCFGIVFDHFHLNFPSSLGTRPVS